MEGPARRAPARRDADEESEEEELGEEEEATPALAVKRPKQHSGASPLLVAAVPVPQDPAPPAPVFVARDPTLPPPEHHARGEPKPRYKRKAGVYRGSDVLKTTQPCADSCPFACCRNGGFADALTASWRQQLRDADANGIASRRAYLGSTDGRVPLKIRGSRFDSEFSYRLRHLCAAFSAEPGFFRFMIHIYPMCACSDFVGGGDDLVVYYDRDDEW
jgi:hypothetical protein